MEEAKKLKFKAIISVVASERDEAHGCILDILNNPTEPNPVEKLAVQFRKLSEADKKIETIQQFYTEMLNLEDIKKLQEKVNPEKKENNDDISS